MQWKKGGRQSTNIEDRRGETPEYDPELSIDPEDVKNWQKLPDAHTSDEIKVAKELGRLNREKKTPVPTPRPSNKSNSIYNSQVTPGKWSMKNKI